MQEYVAKLPCRVLSNVAIPNVGIGGSWQSKMTGEKNNVYLKPSLHNIIKAIDSHKHTLSQAELTEVYTVWIKSKIS